MDKDSNRKRRQVVIKEKSISTDEFMAASIGDCEWLDQSLRDGHNPSTFDKNGLAPLHLAAMHGRLQCIKLLVEKYNVDVNMSSSAGFSPLHLSINKDSGSNALMCMRYLLGCGADVHCKTNENVTLLHQAASEGLMDCLLLLLACDAPVDVCDVRGHTAHDVAKLWGHKECARVIQDEMWKREKMKESREKKKLLRLKETYGALQREALQQLHNEQEFYGSVTFGNWLEEKGYSDDVSQAKVYANERYPDSIMKGLASRLVASGGIEDCAARMDRLSAALKLNSSAKPTRKKAQKLQNVTSNIRSKNATVLPRMPQNKISGKNLNEEKLLPNVEIKPKMWNPSTNVDSEPVTNIKNMDKLSLSTKPDEEYISILPTNANLPVKLENDKNKPISIKVLLPGGAVENAGVYIPSLSSDVIRAALCGEDAGRLKVPQEFKAVHIYDVKHKRHPKSPPYSEVALHLRNFKNKSLVLENIK